MSAPAPQVVHLAAAHVMRFRVASMLIAALALASCVNPVDTSQAAAGQECVYVKVTGSNMPVKECRTREEREALAEQNAEAAQQGLRDLRTLEEFGVESPGADSLD